MKKSQINRILQDIENGYDQMAEKFSGTRNFFWPDLLFIEKYIQENAKILDFGCGNGRLLEILKNKNIEYFGTDVSQKLIDLARQKYPEFKQNFIKTATQDMTQFADNFFDNIVAIAVFHHFPDKKFRLSVARDLHRIMKPGGELMVTVWNLWQPKYKKYIWKNTMLKLIGLSRLDFGDCKIPFRDNKGKSFCRFHHAYTLKEMQELFVKAGFFIEEAKELNGKNLFVRARKK